MKKISKFIILAAVAFFAFLPALSLAATKKPFYYAGWIPFWKQQTGAHEISLNLEKLKELSPFSYEVKSNGTLVDKLKINEGFWPGWLSAVRDMNIKIIPTIAWFDGDGIDALLSNKKKRIAHENAITKLVKDQKYDGIDIDYEAKLAETNPYFSLFIEGLAIRLHPLKKILSCTIEPRMPVSSRYSQTNTPEDYLYANDYKILNKFCDEVRIMAYDQGLIDIKLDVEKGDGKLYAPVADVDWVKKILDEAVKTINPKKIMLGVPTYGYEYQVKWDNGVLIYERLRSHTFVQAIERASSTGRTPLRNSAGELSFTYTTSTWVGGVSPSLNFIVASNQQPAELASLGNGSVLRYVSFSDADAIKQKIDLAKKMGLRGVVFFKFDGEQDPLFWRVIK
ncbi:MAG: glycosyl hydrolase family 18 protein [Candidatus Wolfebacteria bacterium]|nr:glycosyl hydrolase family 18 protein [Candidatus Wolfebacteria bacterium]